MAVSRTELLMSGLAGDPDLCHRLTRRTIVVGDPGLGSFFRKVGGFVGRGAGIGAQFIPGGGAVVGAGRALAARAISSRRPQARFLAPQEGLISRGLNLLPAITPAQARAGGLAIAGAAGGLAGAGKIGQLAGLAGSLLGKLRPGGGAAPTTMIRMPGMRRRRRIRVTNVKALRRATSRLAGFHKLAIRTEAQLSHLVRRRARRSPRAVSRRRT